MFRRVKLSIVLVVAVTVGHGAAVAGTLGDVGVLSDRIDVDGDGDIDLSDFGVLKSEFGKVASPDGPELLADLNGDSAVDLTDFGILKDNFGRRLPASPVLNSGTVSILSSGNPGDVDGDNDVDLSDFGVLKANFGKTGDPVPAPIIPGDITGDGKVDLTDFGILKANFGKHAAAHVPEPSTLLIATLAGLGLVAMRSRGLRGGARRPE